MYRLEFKERARKDLQGLPPKHMRQIQEKIDSLMENPRPPDYKKVISLPGYLRVSSGEYRILYQVDDAKKVVTVVRIRHRREVYK